MRDTDGIIKGYRAEFIHRPPTPERPRDLGLLASGARLRIVEYAPAIESKLNPKPLESGGAPALRFTIATAMMGQRMESWLLADDPQHSSFDMGLARIELKRGDGAARSRLTNQPLPAKWKSRSRSLPFTRRPINRSAKR